MTYDARHIQDAGPGRRSYATQALDGRATRVEDALARVKGRDVEDDERAARRVDLGRCDAFPPYEVRDVILRELEGAFPRDFHLADADGEDVRIGQREAPVVERLVPRRRPVLEEHEGTFVRADVVEVQERLHSGRQVVHVVA